MSQSNQKYRELLSDSDHEAGPDLQGAMTLPSSDPAEALRDETGLRAEDEATPEPTASAGTSGKSFPLDFPLETPDK